ncbi:MAG TPA: P-type DNA transfer ATPase VirB11, partial [Erythrobacter sp.]|nr:P-type DNA transfer ATPase VirB11 [Erythrobacter sp.]
MSADIHPFQPDGQPEADAPPVDLHGERSVYLDAYLAPFRDWLECDTVTEILVNRPGEVWVEDAARGGMHKVVRPDI